MPPEPVVVSEEESTKFQKYVSDFFSTPCTKKHQVLHTMDWPNLTLITQSPVVAHSWRAGADVEIAYKAFEWHHFTKIDFDDITYIHRFDSVGAELHFSDGFEYTADEALLIMALRLSS